MAWKVYIIPHFHYDAAWLKTKEEYLQICHRHILEVLKLLRTYPEYCFLLEQAYLIKTFLQRYPEEEPYFRACVKEGRIELTGMYVCPDVNIPSGEALIRQIKAGKEYFQQEFGLEVKTGYLVDVFGSHPQLPQIMKRCGIEVYLFGRGMDRKKALSEFVWRGIDGSEILALWLPLTACNLWPVPENEVEFSLLVRKLVRELQRLSPTGLVLLMSGYDYSAPSPELPFLVSHWKNKDFRLQFITLKEYTRLISQRRQQLPVLSDDFNPVFQGCYSSRIGLKLKNRQLEMALYQCEALAAMNTFVGSSVSLDLESAWEKVLFNQFHDIISGTHTDEVYQEAWQDYCCAEKFIQEQTERLLITLAGRMAQERKGPAVSNGKARGSETIDLAVINTLPWSRTDVVETEISFSRSAIYSLTVLDHQSNPVLHQEKVLERFSDGGLKLVRITFLTEALPAFGFRIYSVVPSRNPLPEQPAVAGKPLLYEQGKFWRGKYDQWGLLELAEVKNRFFSCRFDVKRGIFLSLKNKQGRELINPELPLGGVITREPDEGDPWQYHEGCEGGETIASNRIFRFPEQWAAGFSHLHRLASTGNATMKQGPVFTEIVSRSRFGSGSRSVVVRIYQNLPRIEVSTTLENRERAVRYRVHLPTTVRKGTITREIAFGAIHQPEGEFPCQNWLDYSDGRKGLAVLNKGIVGQGVVEDIIMLALTRGINRGEEISGNFSGAEEVGSRYTFEYALVPHSGDWKRANLPRQGLEYNCPLLVKKMGVVSPLFEKREASFLKIEPENTIVTMVKPAGQGIAVRLYETQGKRTRSRITVSQRFTNLVETDALEKKYFRKILRKGKTFSFSLGPYQIKTFLLR
ncbi:MAG TPA: glycoside hydrolase family 38 C-terminal domain-containing protein [bacterium]|nr:glycoside hydrolase family 38 C-terminal domain-containing protein [bacterium]